MPKTSSSSWRVDLAREMSYGGGGDIIHALKRLQVQAAGRSATADRILRFHTELNSQLSSLKS